MQEPANANLVFSESARRRTLKTIERSLDLSAKAEDLRKRARDLCETSRLLREKSSHLSFDVGLRPELFD